MSLLDFLGFGRRPDPQAAEIEGVRTIVQTLGSMEPDQARYLAAFAYILSRIAHVDQRASPHETAAIERVVADEGLLPGEHARLVVEMAKAQSALFGGMEDFLVTREFSRRASHEQKLALLHCLFSVSAADEHIAAIEDNEIRRISRELRIEHADFVAVRSAHRQHLGVLKPDDPD